MNRGLTWSSSRETCNSGLHANVTEKDSSTGVWWFGLVTKLGSKCQHCTGSYRWPCNCAKGYGREMVLASSFNPRGFLHECSLACALR